MGVSLAECEGLNALDLVSICSRLRSLQCRQPARHGESREQVSGLQVGSCPPPCRRLTPGECIRVLDAM
ncbi:hypothetical protein C8Q76DRAFT_663837 [Earliella scabrosa]|nr:hypothetical protein C8Q76DRAFT_663837 [Earliella scabrosa]